MDKLVIAVFGGGYWGKNLIRNFRASDEGEVKIVIFFITAALWRRLR